MTDTPTNGANTEDPEAPPDEPSGLARDVFDLAALVNTVKTTFKFKEETALKTIDLALTYRLTKEQMAYSGMTPPVAKLMPLPDEPPAPDTE